MRDAISVRAATNADYESLSALWEGVDVLHRQAMPHMFHAPRDTWPERATIEHLIAGPDSTILAAIADGAVVGFATLLLKRQTETEIRVARDYVEVEGMAVDPKWQRHGVGRALMRAAEAWAKERGIARLELNVYSFNTEAARFYEGQGFAPVLTRVTRKIAP